MSYIYNNNIKKKNNLNFYSYKIWRLTYLIKLNPLYHITEKKFFTRSSVIPTFFYKSKILIYTGKKWVKRWVTLWMVGYKLGEFTWNRKLPLYKKKRKK